MIQAGAQSEEKKAYQLLAPVRKREPESMSDSMKTSIKASGEKLRSKIRKVQVVRLERGTFCLQQAVKQDEGFGNLKFD